MSKQQSVPEYIEENGPSTGDELPFSPLFNHKIQDGVLAFDASPRGLEMPTIVYYVEDSDPAAVIDKWVTVNQDYVDSRSPLELHQGMSKHGERFHEVSKERFGPFHDHHSGGGQTDMESCPLCSAPVGKALSEHLPECEAA